MNKIQFIGLGGLDEKGKNMYAIDIDNDIFIFDAGLKYPSGDAFGVDLIIPNFDYIIKNKERIKGIFISHAHEDQIGSLPFLLKKVHLPIYATSLSAESIKILLNKSGVRNYKVITIQKDRDVIIGDYKVKPFSLTHSFPDHVGFAVEKKGKQVVYTTDYIFDPQNKWKEFKTDYDRIGRISKSAKTLLLLSESIGTGRVGYVAPHQSISEIFTKSLASSKGRLIVGSYEEKIFQLKEMIEIAIKNERRIIFYGRTFDKYVQLMIKYGWIKIPNHLITSFKDINKYTNSVIFVVGSGERLYNKLSKIATDEDEFLSLNKTDSVLITAAAIPGTELIFTKIIDDFYKNQIKAHGLKRKHVVGAHAATADLQQMIREFSPKNIIPIKGEYRHFVSFNKVAADMGYDDKNVIMPENGDIYLVNEKEIKYTGQKVDTTEQYVDGLGVGDIGAVVIRERSIMQESGIFMIAFTIDKKLKKIVAGPDVQMRGFIVVDDKAKELALWACETFESILKNELEKPKFDWPEARNEARAIIARRIRKEFNLKPVILPLVLDV